MNMASILPVEDVVCSFDQNVKSSLRQYTPSTSRDLDILTLSINVPS